MSRDLLNMVRKGKEIVEVGETQGLQSLLSTRLAKADLERLLSEMGNDEGDALAKRLYGMVFSEEKRVADNAAWVLSHAQGRSKVFLQSKQNELIDEAMQTSSTTKRRLLLTILLAQTFSKDELRTDFLDFCLSGIADGAQPVAVRSLSVYLAFAQCRHHAELLNELEQTLDLLEEEVLTPAVKCARNRVLRQIVQINKNRHGLSSNH